MQVLIDAAGGLAAFNALATMKLGMSPPVDQPHEYMDTYAKFDAFNTIIAASNSAFLFASPDDVSNVALTMRTYCIKRDAARKLAYFQRRADGWIETPFDIQMSIDWLQRFQILYLSIYNIPLGGVALSKAGEADLKRIQEAGEERAALRLATAKI